MLAWNDYSLSEQAKETKNILSTTLSPIDLGIPSGRKGWKFSSFPKRDGEWRGAGCIGTSFNGSWRSSCGSCLAGRLFPGDQCVVRTGKESSASNITPPATEAERPNIRFISKLGASNSTGVGIIANPGRRGSSERKFHGGTPYFEVSLQLCASGKGPTSGATERPTSGWIVLQEFTLSILLSPLSLSLSLFREILEFRLM